MGVDQTLEFEVENHATDAAALFFDTLGFGLVGAVNGRVMRDLSAFHEAAVNTWRSGFCFWIAHCLVGLTNFFFSPPRASHKVRHRIVCC